MTEAQARAFVAQVQQEFPGQIETSIGRSRGGQNDYGYVVKLTLKHRTLTAYQPGEWQEIKWAWGLENAPKTKRQTLPKYLIDGIPMSIAYRKDGYWFARYWRDGKEHRKFFSKGVDPRPLYPLVEKEEVTI